MNSRDRVLTTIAHMQPNSVPLFSNEIMAMFVRTITIFIKPG